jgi:hypothetical protein
MEPPLGGGSQVFLNDFGSAETKESDDRESDHCTQKTNVYNCSHNKALLNKFYLIVHSAPIKPFP